MCVLGPKRAPRQEDDDDISVFVNFSQTYICVKVVYVCIRHFGIDWLSKQHKTTSTKSSKPENRKECHAVNGKLNKTEIGSTSYKTHTQPAFATVPEANFTDNCLGSIIHIQCVYTCVFVILISKDADAIWCSIQNARPSVWCFLTTLILSRISSNIFR